MRYLHPNWKFRRSFNLGSLLFQESLGDGEITSTHRKAIPEKSGLAGELGPWTYTYTDLPENQSVEDARFVYANRSHFQMILGSPAGGYVEVAGAPPRCVFIVLGGAWADPGPGVCCCYSWCWSCPTKRRRDGPD